jgi:hypothetical protein
MYPFVIEATYWDDAGAKPKLTAANLLIYAERFADACERAEAYLGDIEDLHIFCVGDEATLFEIPCDIAEAMIAGDGNYEKGVIKLGLD